MGAQKNRLNETVLLSTQNICEKLWVRKYLQFHADNFCLSKPVLFAMWATKVHEQKREQMTTVSGGKRVIGNMSTKKFIFIETQIIK